MVLGGRPLYSVQPCRDMAALASLPPSGGEVEPVVSPGLVDRRCERNAEDGEAERDRAEAVAGPAEVATRVEAEPIGIALDPDVLAAVERCEEADARVLPVELAGHRAESPVLRGVLSEAILEVAAADQPPLAGVWLSAETFELARSFPARTLRDIPRSARRPFASLRAEVAAECRGSRKAEHQRLFDLLPLLIFSAPARQRGGKKHKRKGKADIVAHRIAKIRTGDAERLLTDVLREQHTGGPQAAAGSTEVPWGEVLRLCAAHELSRATALLGTSGVAPRTRETAARMRAKLETPVRTPVEPPDAQAGRARWGDMRLELETRLPAALRSAPRGSAAGWSGDRFEFHKATYVAASEAEWAVLLDVYTDYATGEVPPEVAAGWRRARGFAILKGDGVGIRPIAAHEPLRRAVTRALIKGAESTARDRLAPLQSAIGVHGGAEALGLAARLFAQRHPTWVVLKLDISNAFGSCSRAAALRELEAAGPDCALLAFFLRRLLCEPSIFAYDFIDEAGESAREIIAASEGADQGDPAGPLIFCAAFAPVLRAIRERLAGINKHYPFDARRRASPLTPRASPSKAHWPQP